MPDLRQGCTTGKPSEDTAPADALVLFGVMGDLAHKKIFPALYQMVRYGHLDVPVIGVARAARTDEHLKEQVRDSIQQQGGDIDQEALAKLLKLLREVGLHEKCARHCRETLWARSCLGAAVECRSSCRASGIENLSYRPLPR